MEYPRINRILHALIALLIVGQLISEEWMKRPKPGRLRTEDQIWFFDAHEFLGITLLIIVVLRLTLLSDNKEDINRLFPWLTKPGFGHLLAELKSLPAALTAAPSGNDYLAGTVHGLGLLLALGLGLAGSILFVGMNPDGSMPDFVHLMKELHEVLGSLLWIYILGHGGMALLHQFFGHRSLQRIFRLGKD